MPEQNSIMRTHQLSFFSIRRLYFVLLFALSTESRRVNVLKLEGGGGATYIRWCRTSCSGSNDTVTKVYEGTQ